jgi:aldose 1-epimerase
MSERSHPTVTLSDPSTGMQASFVPDAGMLCRSLRHRDQELLAQNAGVQAYAEHGKTMGIPLLYPWANRLAGFDYEAAGRSVALPHDRSLIQLDPAGLPIHGVIPGALRWNAQPPEGADEPQTLRARLDWSEQLGEAFAAYPFHHRLLYEATLADGELRIAVTVHAHGADTVPLTFGFHPYLCPGEEPREQWLIELPAMRKLALDQRQIPTGPDRKWDQRSFELAEREFDDGFDSLAPHARFSVSTGTGVLQLEFLEGYPCAQVYAPLATQFICFEPMSAPTNALRSGEGLRLLSPGERHRASFVIRMLVLD